MSAPGLCAFGSVGYISAVPRRTRQGASLLNCQQLVDFCLDFLDGSLPEDEQRMFRSHLGCCGECVAFFETYKRTPEVSREAFALEVPASVKEAVRSYLRTRYELHEPAPEPAPRDPSRSGQGRL
jgi:anti-sigma factor RsiW